MHNEGGPQFELPPQPPLPEQPSEQGQEQVVERQRPAAPERAPKPGSTAVQDVAKGQVPDISAPTGQAPAHTQASPTSDLTATGGDLIEKQWVERIKSIEAQTKDDPRRQKELISRAAEDFQAKTFNHRRKTDDSVAA